MQSPLAHNFPYSYVLDLLLSLNTSDRLAPSLRYEIHTPPLSPTSSELPTDGKTSLGQKEVPIEVVREAASTPLSQLSSIPHSSLETCLATGQLPSDIRDPMPEVYMDLRHEEDYLHALLEEADGLVASGPSNATKAYEREREAALKNPVSVYNWLRKHQPGVFLQDGETSGDKKEKIPKEGRTGKKGKDRAEELDEDGLVVGSLLVDGKVKRKRDDDAYRPKGGNNRPSKRKKISVERRSGLGSDGM